MKKLFAMLSCVFLLAACGGGGSGVPSQANQGSINTLSAPTSVVAKSSASINSITWLPVDGATSYNIYWSTSPSVTKSTGNKIINASSPYVHSSTTDTITYFYIVTALKDGVESDASSVRSITSSKVVGIDAYEDNVIALKSDGSVWTWGHLNNINTQTPPVIAITLDSDIPKQVPNISSITKVSSGAGHYVVLKSDGTVWAWGYNSVGQLGNGTTANSNSPVLVNISDVIDISSGFNYTLALKRNGTVWAWGANFGGELGNLSTSPNTDYRTSPVQVQNVSNIIAINAKSVSGVNYAIQSDGTMWAWGIDGTLNGVDFTNSLPLLVPGLNNVTKAEGKYILKADSTLWMLGNTSNIYNISLFPNIGNVADMPSYDNGNSVYSTVVKTDGTVWAYVPNAEFIYSWVKINPLDDALSISTTSSTTLILRRNGTIVGWGSDTHGILGNVVSSYSYLNPVVIDGI